MKEKNKSIGYLSELRKRIIVVMVFFAVCLAVGMLFSKRLVLMFLNSNLPANVNLVTLNPYENVSLFIHFMFFVGIALTVPFAIYQIIMFIKPGLSKEERRIAITAPFIALILFVIGAVFGYFLTKSVIVPFLSNLALGIGISNNWSIDQFMKFIVYLSLAMGLVFQMPLIMSLLVRLNIVRPGQLKKTRRYAIIILLGLAAFITPPDVFSLIIMVVPLILLFEVTIFITKFMKRGARA